MLGFYTIRKLVEAHQVPDHMVSKGMRLQSCPSTGRAVTFMNYHRFAELYDFSQAAVVSKDLLFVCNQVVHSYVFAPLFRPNGQLQAILFNSDRTRNRELFIATIKDVVGTFRRVGSSDPASLDMKFDDARSDYRVTVGKSMRASRDA